VLRTNLSTRPFYNERAVHLLLALAGVIVLSLTVFNAIRIVALSSQNTEFSSMINRDRAEALRLNAEAQRIRAGINQTELQATAAAAAEANRLIEQRTFSWTEFFNRIEETLPDEVMLTAVHPSFDDDQPIVTMTVLGRQTEDIEEFIERLEGTGAFADVLPSQTDTTEDGLNRVIMRAVYSSTSDSPAPKTVDRPAAEGAAREDAEPDPDEEKPADDAGGAAPPDGPQPAGRGGRGQ
jgi:hypothetical protein